MTEESDSKELSVDELREAFEVVKEYAPLTQEQAQEFLDDLGGSKKITLDLYEAYLRQRDYEMASNLIADVEARSHNQDPEIAQEFAEILAEMKHDD